MGGDAPLEGEESAQKIQLPLRPTLDVSEILGPRHRAAKHDEKDFRQWIQDLPRLTGVFQSGEMIKKRRFRHRRPR